MQPNPDVAPKGFGGCLNEVSRKHHEGRGDKHPQAGISAFRFAGHDIGPGVRGPEDAQHDG